MTEKTKTTSEPIATSDFQRGVAVSLVWGAAGCNAPEYVLTWTEKRTPAGRSVPRIVSRPKPGATIHGWATPLAGDAKNARNETAVRRRLPPTGLHAGQSLCDQVYDLPGWSTRPEFAKESASGLSPEETPSSNAATARRGALNPAHSRWLQGYPSGHDLSSPGWSSWELIQRTLAETSPPRDGTASPD